MKIGQDTKMMNLMIYQIEKEKNQSASFVINTKKVSIEMRRNTEDDNEKYLSQVSDFDGFQWELEERAERICGERIL